MEADSIQRFFQEYEDSRKAFVKTCADLAAKPEHLSALRGCAALDLLFPLLLDPVALIRQVATLAIGRLAQRDEACARRRRPSRASSRASHRRTPSRARPRWWRCA